MSNKELENRLEFVKNVLAKYVYLVGNYEGISFIYRDDWTDEEYEVMHEADIKARSFYD